MTPAGKRRGNLLVADDQKDVLEALRMLLKPEGYAVDLVTSPPEIIKAVRTRDYDVLLMDLNYTRDTTSGKEGLDLLHQIGQLDEFLPVVVMTAWGNIQLTVEAMRRGARDFIQKPWDNSRLLSILKTQIDLGKALRKGKQLEDANRVLTEKAPVDFIAESRVMKPIMDLITRIGPSDANVLITGENGTGKNVIAELLHARSNRGQEPFVTVNIAGLSESLMESELFGHVKGAFTDARTDRVGRFELADSGTLFLDEIANIPISQQTKLLRVLETGEYERVGSSKTRCANVRFVSATNADISKDVTEGRFRQDLYFRLNTVEVHLPPLRERREDIPLLARHFLKRHVVHYRTAIQRDLLEFHPQAMEALVQYTWPGNIRELDHVVERSVLMARSSQVELNDLGIRSDSESVINLEEMDLEDIERIFIRKALERHHGNVSKAAKTLGLSRSGLYRRLQKHGL